MHLTLTRTYPLPVKIVWRLCAAKLWVDSATGSNSIEKGIDTYLLTIYKYACDFSAPGPDPSHPQGAEEVGNPFGMAHARSSTYTIQERVSIRDVLNGD